MNIKLLISSILLSVCPVAISAQILDIDGEESTSVGIYIKDISTGEVLMDYISGLALTPASVTKVITTATALSIKGANGHFTTNVVLRGEKAATGVWNGDIVVQAVADPTIESAYFKSKLGFCDSIVAALKRNKITKINGTIVVENSLKDEGPILQWELEDIAWPYGAGLFGFNYRDNSATVYPNRNETKPIVPDVEICVKKADRNDVVRGVYSNKLVVFTRDTNDKKWGLSISVPDPAAVFRQELISKLNAAGISSDKKQRTKTGSETVIYSHSSPSYSDIMRSLMVRSDNMFAEGMLRSIMPKESRRDVIKREKELWSECGIDASNTIINDGSGLTRANRLSARFIGDVLEYMANSQYAMTYASFFPRVGIEGTVKSFLQKTALAGTIALKTGSVSSVQSYAGYKLDSEGIPTHVIVILVNGFFCQRKYVREAAENLLLDFFN